MKTLYLIGYEKETPKQFFGKIKRKGITTVIDVREIPVSRKNGFSKQALSRELKKLGVTYYHFPQLGSPSTIRKKLYGENADYIRYFKDYRKYVKKKKDIVKEVEHIISKNGKNSSLLCFEKNSDLCHRSIVASEILKLNPKMTVTPI